MPSAGFPALPRPDPRCSSRAHGRRRLGAAPRALRRRRAARGNGATATPYSRVAVRQSPCTSITTWGLRPRASARPTSAGAAVNGLSAMIASGRKSTDLPANVEGQAKIEEHAVELADPARLAAAGTGRRWPSSAGRADATTRTSSSRSSASNFLASHSGSGRRVSQSADHQDPRAPPRPPRAFVTARSPLATAARCVRRCDPRPARATDARAPSERRARSSGDSSSRSSACAERLRGSGRHEQSVDAVDDDLADAADRGRDERRTDRQRLDGGVREVLPVAREDSAPRRRPRASSTSSRGSEPTNRTRPFSPALCACCSRRPRSGPSPIDRQPRLGHMRERVDRDVHRLLARQPADEDEPLPLGSRLASRRRRRRVRRRRAADPVRAPSRRAISARYAARDDDRLGRPSDQVRARFSASSRLPPARWNSSSVPPKRPVAAGALVRRVGDELGDERPTRADTRGAAAA